MKLIPLWLLIVGLALVSAGSDSDSDSDESNERPRYRHRKHKKHHDYREYTPFFQHATRPIPLSFTGPQSPLPGYPYDEQHRVGPPQVPGYHLYQPFHGIPQHPAPQGYQIPPYPYPYPYPWGMPPGQPFNPLAYYPPPPLPSSSSSSSTSSVASQQPGPVAWTPAVQPPGPFVSTSSNSTAMINEGRGNRVTEEPVPTNGYNTPQVHEQSPGEYIYTLGNSNGRAPSSRSGCGEDDDCRK